MIDEVAKVLTGERNWCVVRGDCIEVMRQMPNNCIDTIVCDPPYGLAFMGKDWDTWKSLKEYQEWTTKWATEVLRIAKPGATLLCFGGTRTSHRLTCGLEDAGWIIKDRILWLYGQGFPKGYDIAKGIESKLKQGSANWTNWKKLDGKKYERKTGYTKLQAEHKYRPDYSNAESKDIEITTPEAKRWQGYKSHALKPAYELIVVAMKSNDGSYVNNALKWDVAGLNIDAARIYSDEPITVHDAPSGTFAGGEQGRGSKKNYRTHYGRYPANVILDEEVARMLDEQTNRWKSSPGGRTKFGEMFGNDGEVKSDAIYTDEGGASRFFYTAKATPSEKGRNNNHPTVKPLKLVEYLVKLTLMPNQNQIYFDPFAGSGTTGVVALRMGRRFIGIDLNPDYVEMARRRIKRSAPLFAEMSDATD